MDVRYEQFCLTDATFYDTPVRAGAGQSFLRGRSIPEGWSIASRETWTVMRPPGGGLPPQGWKVHASATMANASAVLDAVWSYCVPRGISFKFLADEVCLLWRNAKYADRSGSGKFVTIYPTGTVELERMLHELGAALDGLAGPYILSDVRWGDGPLYVRYGGFVERHCAFEGEMVHAIADPDGRLVPDRREPRFVLPEWVDVPDFLAPSIDARLRPDTPLDFPFEIEECLHFSNGGGIYRAKDKRTGRRVVLREARPHAGLVLGGSDAVDRLLVERDILEKLAGSGVVPELYEHFTFWEHHFLVEEFIEGDTLGHRFVLTYPLIHPDSVEDVVTGYTEWALDVLDKVRRGLAVLHDAGIAFGDLHVHNIILKPGGDIRFIDFEVASYLADSAPPRLNAPGFAPPDGRSGIDVDHYAMAALVFSMFLPLTMLLALDPAKVDMLARSIVQRFPVPKALIADAAEVLRDRRGPAGAGSERVAGLSARMDAGEAPWTALRDSIRDAILASATPDRPDRLFPGDIEQFTHGGIGIAHGAAGVLYALERSGAGRFPEHERWLLDAVDRQDDDRRVGFYDGLHGVAYVLAELGRLDDAFAVLERALRTPLDSVPVMLFNGLAGIGLNLLHFAEITGDTSLRERAVDAGSRLAEHLTGSRSEQRAPDLPDNEVRAGLMLGFAGHALLYVRLFEATGERQYLDLAGEALRRDLSGCIVMEDGCLMVDEGWRAEPYIANGSAGFGLVLREFLRHRDDDEFTAALDQIRPAAEPEFIIVPGMFAGRAGLMAATRWLAPPDPATEAHRRSIIERHLARFCWHVVPYRGHVAIPGFQLLRLSMDFASGAAGVLFALSAVLDGDGPVLPFFSRPAMPALSTNLTGEEVTRHDTRVGFPDAQPAGQP